MVDLLNKYVKHSDAFGIGTVTEQDEKYITIQFTSKVSKFAYPDTFEKYLVAMDSADAEALKKEIEESKAASYGKKVSTSKSYIPIKRMMGSS